MNLPKTPSGHVAVIVTVDHFSKWLHVVPIRNKTSATVAASFRGVDSFTSNK